MSFVSIVVITRAAVVLLTRSCIEHVPFESQCVSSTLHAAHAGDLKQCAPLISVTVARFQSHPESEDVALMVSANFDHYHLSEAVHNQCHRRRWPLKDTMISTLAITPATMALSSACVYVLLLKSITCNLLQMGRF